jgi:hypothetical protein
MNNNNNSGQVSHHNNDDTDREMDEVSKTPIFTQTNTIKQMTISTTRTTLGQEQIEHRLK